MASSSSSSAVTLRMKYDMFLSFSEDTRYNFTDHLYTALGQRGFDTFIDDEKPQRGTKISSELIDIIEGSWSAIVVLSRGYACSTWCLEELAKIMECMDEKGLIVFPIFYQVNPSDVRKQVGDFKEAFDKHEEKSKGDKDMVEKWRAALTKVGKLTGWDLQDKPEAKTILNIADYISRSRYKTLTTSTTRYLFGIDSNLEKINECLAVEGNDVRFIGIHGMGGIGKTTIARVLYESLSFQYKGSSFLTNIREVSKLKGLCHLQEQLLSEILLEGNLKIWNENDGKCLTKRRLCKKKVLLVLDDVDQLEQLAMLAGACDWFGPGSRIIITTRNEHLLVKHGVSWRHKVEELNDDDALRLFHSKVFRMVQPTVEYSKISHRVIEFAKGLPLALEILGSYLCDRSFSECESLLNRLQEYPSPKLFQVHQITYDGLEENEKEIFLDIACFFNGKKKDQVVDVLEKCGRYSPDVAIQVLVERSLIIVSEYNELQMHGLIQEMGWNIIREQHPAEPGKWSRLWLHKDVHFVLENNKGTEAIEGIFLDMPLKEITHLGGICFSGMSNLRLLKVNSLYFSDDLKYLPNQLRYLEWHGYPSKSLPSSFQANKLVELKMHNSNMKYLWSGIKGSETLKTMELCHSYNLTETPDFIGIPNLERLNLEGCTRLLKVHKSIGNLPKLIELNLKNCKNLVSLPHKVSGMKSLKILNLHGCLKLKKLPSDLGEAECLEKLYAGETAVREWLPSDCILSKYIPESNYYGRGGDIKPWLHFDKNTGGGASKVFDLVELVESDEKRKRLHAAERLGYGTTKVNYFKFNGGLLISSMAESSSPQENPVTHHEMPDISVEQSGLHEQGQVISRNNETILEVVSGFEPSSGSETTRKKSKKRKKIQRWLGMSLKPSIPSPSKSFVIEELRETILNQQGIIEQQQLKLTRQQLNETILNQQQIIQNQQPRLTSTGQHLNEMISNQKEIIEQQKLQLTSTREQLNETISNRNEIIEQQKLQLTSTREQLNETISNQKEIIEQKKLQLISTRQLLNEMILNQQQTIQNQQLQLISKQEQHTSTFQELAEARRRIDEQTQMISNISSTCQRMEDFMRHNRNDPPLPSSTGSGSPTSSSTFHASSYHISLSALLKLIILPFIISLGLIFMCT